MVSDKVLTTLLLVGGGVYVIERSGILGSIGSASKDVGEGVGDAARGLGGGLGAAGAGLGGGIGRIGQNLGGATDPLLIASAVGQGVSSTLREGFSNIQANLIREQSQREEVDIAAFTQSKDQIAQLQAGKDVNKSIEQLQRSIIVQQAGTEITEDITKGATSISGFIGKAPSAVASFLTDPFGVRSFLTNIISSDKRDTAQTQTNQTPTSTSQSSSGGGSSPTTSSRSVTARSVRTTPIRPTPLTSTPQQRASDLNRQIRNIGLPSFPSYINWR